MNVEVADKNGKSASAFLTINAKPSASLTSNFLKISKVNKPFKSKFKIPRVKLT